MNIPILPADLSTVRFIVITVPKGVVFRKFSSIIQLIKHVGETYTAASYPPHITLRTGAIVPKQEVDNFIEGFGNHVADWKSFEIETEGIAQEEHLEEGDSSYFFYYRIKQNKTLDNLHKMLRQYEPYIKSRNKQFHPHLSLAYKDVTRSGYERIKELLRSKKEMFPSSLKWTCDNICLYFQKNYTWMPYHVFSAADAVQN
ncbi:MAG: 2'-5' RNA ligase family protein [Proteobacteria bacterium]|nr:2'-5' RNA ligase family protein [Pseudomonadota bacterium]